MLPHVRVLAAVLALGFSSGGLQSTEADLRLVAREVVEALAELDFARLANLVHPEKGVLLFPSTLVEPQSHVTLTPVDLRGVAAGDGMVRTWGEYEASVEPIRLRSREYFDRFVYDAPYLEKGRVGIDVRQGRGGTLDVTPRIWPEARIVEYHVSGVDPHLGGADWRSLRLVFERLDGQWYLVGLVHDEWTV